MDKKEEVGRRKRVKEDKGSLSSKDTCGKKKKKRGWSDVFDNVTYSSGPGDNIYVFG